MEMRLMVQPSQIHQHMEVIGSDGGHVGKVDHVIGDEIELMKLDLGSGLKHHMVPMTWVDRVEDGKVCLNRTKDAAKSAWKQTI
jgi:hypothetical protein